MAVGTKDLLNLSVLQCREMSLSLQSLGDDKDVAVILNTVVPDRDWV